MTGRNPNAFITKYRADDAGKSQEIGSETLLTCDIVGKWYVEQMLDRIKSPCWILQVLACLWCFLAVALLVFIHLSLWVTAEVLRKAVWLSANWHSQIAHTIHLHLTGAVVISLPLFCSFSEVSITTLQRFTSEIKSDEICSNSSDPNSAISFAFIHAEKLTLRMKNGLGSSKYKPAEYKRLQEIVAAKQLESDIIGQKVNFTRYQYHACA